MFWWKTASNCRFSHPTHTAARASVERTMIAGILAQVHGRGEPIGRRCVFSVRLGTCFLCLAMPCGAGRSPDPPLPEPFGRLLPLHKRLGPPAPGEWLAVQKGPGQTYDEYVRSKPVRPDGTRRVIYVQPLGTLTKPAAKGRPAHRRLHGGDTSASRSRPSTTCRFRSSPKGPAGTSRRGTCRKSSPPTCSATCSPRGCPRTPWR